MNKYEIKVGPGETKIILLKAEIAGFSMSSNMSSFIKINESHLHKLCLEDESKE